jgi:signal transduction histidine kinase
VGVWLMNERQDAALLRAFSGRLPESPFPRGYELPLNVEKSVIARVCRAAEIYLAQDVQVDPYYMPTEHLPYTCSELALPLRSGAHLIGALDFQSDRPCAFGAEDITALRVLADQIAVAIRNAQLYSQVVRFNEQLESRVRERTAQLEQAYRQLELLDDNKADFIRVMSHELRTPLTLVKGYAQMLIEDHMLAANDPAHEMVLGIASGAQRLHDLVSSMLDMGRIDTGTVPLKFQPILLADLLTALRFDLTVPLQQRSLALTLENLRGLPAIEGDVAALRKVFEHLLLNAIKYTPDGGRITVTGRCMHDPAAEPCEQFVELVVADTGIGIAREFQELIFMKFYQTGEVALHSSGRTKYKGGGPGLGLAIARGMVEAHGGRIWVESPGYDEAACPGSQFHVVLPVRPLPRA